jgi:plasmid stabilization system protein ParE
MTAYDFHPEARADLDEIWEFIRADALDAADRVIAEILSAIRGLDPFPRQATDARTSLRAVCASSGHVDIKLITHQPSRSREQFPSHAFRQIAAKPW